MKPKVTKTKDGKYLASAVLKNGKEVKVMGDTNLEAIKHWYVEYNQVCG